MGPLQSSQRPPLPPTLPPTRNVAASPGGWAPPLLGMALPWRWWSGARLLSCCCCCSRAGICTWWESGGCPCLAGCCLWVGEERDVQTGGPRGSAGGQMLCGVLPSLPKNRLRAWGRQTREAEVERGVGSRRGAPGADETEQHGKHVPMAACLGLALLCPCSSPGWVTPRGQQGVHCMEVSVGTRAPTGVLAAHPADRGAAALPPGALRPVQGDGESCRGFRLAAGSGRFQALPFTSHLSHQAHAGSSEHCFTGAQGSRESESRRLPQMRSLPPSQARHFFASFIQMTLLCLPAARPTSLPVAAHSGFNKHHAVSAWPPAPLQWSRAGYKHPAGFSKCKGLHVPAQKHRHVLPCNVVVLTCFGSALHPVPPMALAPGLPGAALGSPPSGCLGPCMPSLPSLVARVKCVLRPV